MNKYLSQFANDFRTNLKWLHGWIIGINLFVVMAVLIYPGEEALQGFIGLLDQEYFQAFLGQLDVENPSYSLWLALMIPFISLSIAFFGLLFGVRLAVLAVSDETGELIHTQPMQRPVFVTIRFLVGVVGALEFFLIFGVLISIDLVGEAIATDVVFEISWWGMIFLLALISLGMVIGTVAADTGRGNMIALMAGVFMYAIQIIGRFLPGAEDFNQYNPLTWYTPENVVLGNPIPDNVLTYALALLVISLSLSLFAFMKRDLIPEAGLTIPIVSNFMYGINGGNGNGDNGEQTERVKTDRDSLFVRWARPLEKRLPFAADFIYSERRVIVIMFWVLILFYPMQLMAFDPNDPEFVQGLEQTIQSFGSTGIMRVFTYGHQFTDLWLWLMITQAIGVHWFFFIPLTAHWIKKIIRGDTENETAEIYGALPLDHKSVLLQRMFAVFLELLFFVAQTIFWLLLSEYVRDISYNTTWEIIALLGVIPLYLFLVTTGVVLGLLLDQGATLARAGLVVILLLFISDILLEDVTLPNLMGLYDPVLLITDQTLSVANYGLVWLFLGAIISSMLVYLLANQFKWMNIRNDSDPIQITS